MYVFLYARLLFLNLRGMDDQQLVSTLRNVLHHLAFVLENQGRMVQSKLMLWVVFSLQTSIEHLGTDYTLQFLWLRSTTS